MIKALTSRDSPIFHFGTGSLGKAIPGKEEIGGKGHHLAVMSSLGLPVPGGFVIKTDVCRQFLETERLPDWLRDQVAEAVSELGNHCGRWLWSEDNPLLVSVRSGSVNSMPGMLETILDIGLTERSVVGLARRSGNPRFAWDSYRRLIQSFGSIVHQIPRARFEEAFEHIKAKADAVLDRELDVESHKEVVARFLSIFESETGTPFPQDPMTQLLKAVEAVFRSWLAPRAVEYRKLNNIPESDGTAVTVQAMVFGNHGFASGTGVAFTRNPSTGALGLYADFILNAQGEDVVGGGVDPDGGEDLARSFPSVHKLLVEYGRVLENHFADMQDIEFTVEEGKLFLLQTRQGKRTPLAALRVAIDLAEEGVIDRATALERLRQISPLGIRQARLEIPPTVQPMARGEVASIGSLSGRVAFNSEMARRLGRDGLPVILMRPETRTEDLPGIIASDGIITARGGRTSHAAVVARHMGKPCITGCAPLEIDDKEETARLERYEIIEGDWISMDGHTGNVYSGRFESRVEQPERQLQTIRRWARELGVEDHPILGGPRT